MEHKKELQELANYTDKSEQEALEEQEREEIETKSIEKLQKLLDDGKIILTPEEHHIQVSITKIFGGRSYRPKWAVTDGGRIYSLSDEDWLAPYVMNNYWAVGGGSKKNKYVKTAYVHQLVADNYCNPYPRIIYGDDTDVHHINNYRIPEEFRYDGTSRDARIAECAKANNAANLRYENHSAHMSDHGLTNGRQIKSAYFEPNALTRLMLNQGQCDDRTKPEIWREWKIEDVPEYDEDGKPKTDNDKNVITHKEMVQIIHTKATIGQCE